MGTVRARPLLMQIFVRAFTLRSAASEGSYSSDNWQAATDTPATARVRRDFTGLEARNGAPTLRYH